jgi:hypothetical protein
MSSRYEIYIVMTEALMNRVGLEVVKETGPTSLFKKDDFYLVHYQNTKANFERGCFDYLEEADWAEFKWTETCHDYADHFETWGLLEGDDFEVEVEFTRRIVVNDYDAENLL